MSILALIFLAIALLAGSAAILMYFKLRSSKIAARSLTSDYYKARTDYSLRNRVYELTRSVFGSLNKIQRKSPVLIAAEQFKKNLGLGKFVVFSSERNLLIPLMGVGVKLRSIQALKPEIVVELFKDGDDKNVAGQGKVLADNSPEFENIRKNSGLKEDFNKPFIYNFKSGSYQTLFIGEDVQGELAGLCLIPEFNKAVWPIIYDICHGSSNLKRYQERVKTLQGELNKAKTEIGGLNKKVRSKTIDLHAFYRISNKMFTVYESAQLIEALFESVKAILDPANAVVLMRGQDDSGLFKVAGSNGKSIAGLKTLELSLDSEVFNLLKAKKGTMILPAVSSGLPNRDTFLDTALAQGYIYMEKLVVANEITGLVLISDKRDSHTYEEPDLEVFSTIANMASLALDNIHQYSLIEKMSYTDYLTEIYNYRYFYKRLKEEIYRAKRFDRMLALVIFDIDNFKTFNDTYGHQAGDEVLKNMARLVTKSVRAIDIVSRYGGEEFCIIMPDTGFANCLIFIERLRKMIERHKFTSKLVDEGYSITVSTGGAVYPIDSQTPDRLIYCADMALLKAKSDGRNRSMMFNSLLLDDEKLVKSSQQQLTDMGIYEDL